MKKMSRTTSDRGYLFACFTDYRMTDPGLGMKAFGPPLRFSTQLWRSSRRPQLVQKGGQSPSYLRQRPNRGACLPRSIAILHQRTSQHQEIVSAGDDVRPAFRPLRGTQPWHIPEQLLFVKAIAMLMRVAQPIGRTDLGQRSRAITFPDKPTDLGITSLPTGPMTDDLDQRNLHPARRAQVQVVPTPHLDPRPFGIKTFPGLIRCAVAALVLALKAVPILATGSQLAGKTRRGWTVEDAITFDPQQARSLDRLVWARGPRDSRPSRGRQRACSWAHWPWAPTSDPRRSRPPGGTGCWYPPPDKRSHLPGAVARSPQRPCAVAGHRSGRLPELRTSWPRSAQKTARTTIRGRGFLLLHWRAHPPD